MILVKDFGKIIAGKDSQPWKQFWSIWYKPSLNFTERSDLHPEKQLIGSEFNELGTTRDRKDEQSWKHPSPKLANWLWNSIEASEEHFLKHWSGRDFNEMGSCTSERDSQFKKHLFPNW